ncbi:hypothetical protein [Geomonas propionica]|uniref:Uncharacterized protein n=1 Tax=Geomonas propionica TaxID=2798582 RepID=A0ABS0YX64_9BACT|nr:hypothetical protein [Geomonas propionica]MBJ6802575.1 hypothetical protein [Geomonas propionica]
MKRLAVVLVAVGLFVAMPAFAAEHEGMKMDTDEGVRECALQAESIQKKINRIQGEIKQGSKKYTAEELKQLQNKLKEANEVLDTITRQ